MGEKEIRDVAGVAFREATDGRTLQGVAAVFDQVAPIWDFEEVIRKGAFTKTIKDRADVFAFWNHDSGSILGRTTNETLLLSEDDHGLNVSIVPPDTQVGRDTRELVRGGYVNKMSFGFEVVRDAWTKREGKPDLRELKELKLYEVSPVPMPAYDGTSISARGAQPVRPEATEDEDRADAAPSVSTSPGPAASTLWLQFNLKHKEAGHGSAEAVR